MLKIKILLNMKTLKILIVLEKCHTKGVRIIYLDL